MRAWRSRRCYWNTESGVGTVPEPSLSEDLVNIGSNSTLFVGSKTATKMLRSLRRLALADSDDEDAQSAPSYTASPPSVSNSDKKCVRVLLVEVPLVAFDPAMSFFFLLTRVDLVTLLTCQSAALRDQGCMVHRNVHFQVKTGSSQPHDQLLVT